MGVLQNWPYFPPIDWNDSKAVKKMMSKKILLVRSIAYQFAESLLLNTGSIEFENTTPIQNNGGEFDCLDFNIKTKYEPKDLEKAKEDVCGSSTSSCKGLWVTGAKENIKHCKSIVR